MSDRSLSYHCQRRFDAVVRVSFRGLALAAMIVLSGGIAARAAGPITYVGADAGAISGGAHATADAAAASFDAAANLLGTTTLIDFEGDPLGVFSNLSIGPGVELNGSDYLGQLQTVQNAPANAASNLYGFNTTAGGSHFVYVQGGSILFTFNDGITAFGAYFSGVQTMFGTSVITFTDGSAQSIDIPGDTAGGVSFVGFTDEGKTISSITINTLIDFIGIDDVRFTAASPSSPATVPEPGIVVTGLSMAGMTGLGLLRGRRRTIRSANASS